MKEQFKPHEIEGPAVRPCGSCPYRRDVPSGVWVAEHYEMLPKYDLETPYQPTGVFLCHQNNGKACAGWAGCHNRQGRGRDLLALRFGALFGVAGAVLDAIDAYVSPVPLWPSGAAAAAHGLAEVEAPGPAAERVIEKVQRRRKVGRGRS